MKNIPSTRTIILAAALSLGLTVAARAADDAVAPAPVAPVAATTAHGLLGQSYVAASYSYIDLHGSNADAHAFNLSVNQGVSDNLDALLDYTYKNAEALAGGRSNQRMFDLGARAFTDFHGIKPYAEAGLGWEWQKAPAGFRENSPAFFAGLGAEFQVAPELTFTPFVRYTDATRHSLGHEVNYGLKAHYWLSEHMGLTAAVSRDNSRDMAYNLGVTLRY